MSHRLMTCRIAVVLCLSLCAGVLADATTQPAVPQARPFQTFLEAIKAGNADQFRGCQSKDIRESQQPWPKKLEEAKGSLNHRYGDYDISRFTYAFAGDETHGVLTISYPDRDSIKLMVVKESDDWKLASH